MEWELVVCVVDGDPATREALAALIDSKGARARTCGSAEEFLRELHQSQCGCLVVDVQLPGMGGLELQQLLLEKGIALPVIILAAQCDVPTAVRAMRKGAVTLLEKPYCKRELWENICKALDQHRKYLKQRTCDAVSKARLTRIINEERRIARRN